MGKPGGNPGGRPLGALGSPKVRPAAAPRNGKPGRPSKECTGFATDVGGGGGTAGGAIEVLKG